MANQLDMTCDRCPVSPCCPRQGKSPSFLRNGSRVTCKVVGGFGRTAVPEDILSKESLDKTKKFGSCLTIVYVPHTLTEDGMNYETELVKIFHPPVLSDREKVQVTMDTILPKSPM